MTNGFIDLRRFSKRGQEVRAIAEILGRKVTLLDGSGDATIEDFAIEKNKRGDWQLSELFVRRPKNTALPFAKGPTEFVMWQDVQENKQSRPSKMLSSYIQRSLIFARPTWRPQCWNFQKTE